MATATSPGIQDWVLGLLSGTVLGGVVLGVGGRVAMRGVAILQEWPPTFSVGGSATIVTLGAVAGGGFALVLLALQSIPRLPRAVALLGFWLVVAGVSLRVLQPVDRDRLMAFPPLVVVFAIAQQIAPPWLRRRF